MPESENENSKDEPGLDELLSLSEAAQRSGLSASHLRLLVRKGDIWGKKLGRNWVTTERAVNEYLARNHKPGPKTKEES
jgi:excisionase family DNA binding protein